jgi:ribose 5-phosphate isomerase A
MSNSSRLEQAMEKAAEKVVSSHVKEGELLGLGSGSAVSKFAKVLGQAVRKERLKVSVVPSSMQAWLLAKENGLTLASDSSHFPESTDIAVDGADQVSIENRSMIKGGGGALLREKVILSSSKRSYILVDSTKVVSKLDKPVPVEVFQFAVESVSRKLRKDLNAESNLRKLEKGYPYFTESGNVILDCKFGPPISETRDLERSIKSVPGVVEAGLFNCAVERFYVGNQDGSVEWH